MSESTIPFQPQPTVSDGEVPGLVSADDGSRNRTILLALGAVAAVLVIALVAYFFVFSGDGADVDGTAAPAPKAAAAPVPGPAAPAVSPATPVRLSAKSFGRDPFKALIVEPVAAVAVAPTGVTVAPAVTIPSTGGNAGTSDVPTSTGSETSSPSTSEAHTFRVVEVGPSNGTVDVKVDGKLFKKLQAGEVFGTYFKVVLISGQVNSFQFGEEKFNVIGTKRLTIA